MSWASKNLRNAQVLRLRADAAHELADNILPDCPHLAKLQQLEIFVRDAGPASSGLLMWLTWLLARASQLSTLSLYMSKLPWLPPVTHLKHLILTFSMDSERIITALSNARGLETLSIKYLQKGAEDGSEELPMGEVPAIHLGRLVHLHSLALTCIMPAALELPQGCSLSLSGLQHRRMASESWDHVFGSLKALRLDCTGTRLASPPNFFADCPNLTKLCIVADKIGAEGSPLPLTGLNHVKVLVMEGSEMYICMPSTFAWETAYFFGSSTVFLAFDDIDLFAKNIAQAYFVVGYDSVKGTWLPRLCAALGDEDIEWEVCGGEDGLLPQIHCPRQEYDIDIAKCWCGACLDCLAAAGLANAEYIL